MLTLPDVQIRQRDFLLQISRAITAQLELDEVLRRVLQASVVMTSAQVGLVALNADGRFRVRAFSSLTESQVELANRHLDGLVEGITREGDTSVLDRELKSLAAAIDPSLRQALALPLIFAGNPLGLLIVFRSYSVPITPNDVQVLQSFADQAAIAVKNAQLYAAVSQERRQLQAILDHSADGVMILGSDLSIQHFNEALVRMTGWPARDAIGAAHDTIIRWANDEHADLMAALEAGYPFDSPVDPANNTLYVEGDLLCRNGQTLSVGITYAPMLSADGAALTNIVANVRDITHFRLAQEMQNTFISVISHELKTPVAIIKGYAATLQREDASWDAATVHETLGVIEDEADRLGALIQDLLLTSKLHAQRSMPLDLADVWLPELATRVVERFKMQTERHHLTTRFSRGFPTIRADEGRLRQLLENLVGNAIKYSPNGGNIEIGGTYDANWVYMTVRDEGIGIAQLDSERVFDRFYRAEDALTRSTQGTGLGLYLAKAIVDAHHGLIDVESKLGEGSTFHVRLPR